MISEGSGALVVTVLYCSLKMNMKRISEEQKNILQVYYSIKKKKLETVLITNTHILSSLSWTHPCRLIIQLIWWKITAMNSLYMVLLTITFYCFCLSQLGTRHLFLYLVNALSKLLLLFLSCLGQKTCIRFEGFLDLSALGSE